MPPAASGSSSCCSAGASSSRLISPINPPLDLDGASDTSAATRANGSPLSRRLRIASAFSLVASSAATLTPWALDGTATRISRRVSVGVVVKVALFFS